MNDIVKSNQQIGVFENANSFEHAQRIAKMLCASSLVPTAYQNNMSNTLVALEMANRVGASPLMVMQNLNIIHGKPSWGSAFIIASINSCGRFEPLQFHMFGEGDAHGCIAYSTDKRTGTRLDSPPITIGMARKEGWYTKSGSKWPTMPDLMLRYRAAAFFGRLYCPEIMLGMQSSEEVFDVHGVQQPSSGGVEKLNATIISAAAPSPVSASNEQAAAVIIEEATLVKEDVATNEELV